jgi:RHS repeat-associated protein
MSLLQQNLDSKEVQINLERADCNMVDANGFVYLRERYCDPVLGRFPNLDPIEGTMEQPQSLNRYSYVQNNPVNLTDPSGLCANNDTTCQTAVSCLERDFPSAYVYWDNRPATLRPCPSPTATHLPSPTPCPTPNQPNVTITPTPRVTVTPVGAKRFRGMSWEADAITTLHEGIKLLQQARS